MALSTFAPVSKRDLTWMRSVRLSFLGDWDELFHGGRQVTAGRFLVKAGRYIRPRAKSRCLRAHSQTSGWSLTAQAPFNNVTRTCIRRSQQRMDTLRVFIPTRSTRRWRYPLISQPGLRVIRSSLFSMKPILPLRRPLGRSFMSSHLHSH